MRVKGAGSPHPPPVVTSGWAAPGQSGGCADQSGGPGTLSCREAARFLLRGQVAACWVGSLVSVSARPGPALPSWGDSGHPPSPRSSRSAVCETVPRDPPVKPAPGLGTPSPENCGRPTWIRGVATPSGTRPHAGLVPVLCCAQCLRPLSAIVANDPFFVNG